jgi:hypothetical protein
LDYRPSSEPDQYGVERSAPPFLRSSPEKNGSA